MKMRPLLIRVTPLLFILVGCGFLPIFLAPSTVTVTMVNSSPTFDVRVRFFYGKDENVFEEVLTVPLINQDGDETIAPGGSFTFTRKCDDLRAFIIDDAELQATLSSPNARTGVLRLGEDFSCGDRLVFTLSHPTGPLPTTLNIATSIEPGAALPQ